MCVPLVAFFSAVVLQSVSAGGVYCAKTARGRAALVLDPGGHRAPDLYRPAHYNLSETESDTDSYRRPAEGSLHDRMYKQANPWSWHNTHSPVQSEYTADQVRSLPRGRSVINRESNFEEVKHVAPPTRGQPDLVNQDPQGRNEPLSFVSNEHDLVVDESVPNRRGMSLSGLPVPQSGGHGTDQRGLAGVGREVPVPGSSGVANKNHIRRMTSRFPSVRRRVRIRIPGRRARPVPRRVNIRSS